jgi:hypothetical protein
MEKIGFTDVNTAEESRLISLEHFWEVISLIDLGNMHSFHCSPQLPL